MPKPFLAAVAAAVMLAACGGSSATVADVQGEAVLFDEVTALTIVEGDTVDPQPFSEMLGLLAVSRIIEREADRQFGLSVTEAELEEELDRRLPPAGEGREAILEEGGWTEEGVALIFGIELLAEKIGDALLADAPPTSEEEARRLYDDNPLEYTEVCSSHILLETEEEAAQALERALAGEDFAALAMELSTGPTGPNGGDLGCSPASGYVVEFATATASAELNVPVGPVQTQFGWHLILVRDRTVTPFEEVRETLMAGLGSDPAALWGQWFQRIIGEASVEVKPEYGTWIPEQPYVLPPAS